MGRAGFAPDDQSVSSLFKFEEGRGEITAMVVKRGDPDREFSKDKCVIAVTIQRKGKNGNPTDDEPVTQSLGVGPIHRFHPGHAANMSADPDDLGDDHETEGNTIFAVEDKGPDKKSGISIFGTSLYDAGVKGALLNGYLPSLVGLDAEFTQAVTGKKDDGGDITSLVVKKGGTVFNLSEINKRAGGSAANGAKPAATKPASASAKPSTTPTPTETAPVSTPAPSGDDESEATALKLVVDLPGKTPTTTTRAKLIGKLALIMAKASVPPKQHKAIKAFFDNKEWLDEKLSLVGATVEGDNITIPAADEAA